MKRQEFLKSACTFGVCSCISLPFISSDILAKEKTPQSKDDWKLGFMQRRFAKLIEVMNSDLEQQQKEKLIEAIGRACAAENKESLMKYKNNPQAFLADTEKEWAEKTEYDKERNTIRIISKKADSCVCPFVDKTKTPKEFCNCSIGNLKETFETILGQKVEAKIEESILYGGQQCKFLISIS